MAAVAVKAQELSKQYRLGRYQSGYETLRDHISRTGRGLLARDSERHEQTIWALRDVSLEIEQGEIVGIIGANGAGKTTLLRILSRITEPTSGYVDVKGRLGSLLEVGTGFHPELTGRDNVYLNGSILGMRRSEITRKFDDIVEFSGVEKLLDTPVKRYSSGMYVRLAFAVAAHFEPDILLVDEVLAVGDTAFQQKCLGKMSEVVSGGRTVVFVSHQLGTVRQLCPRSLLLEGGHVTGDGQTEEILAQYLSGLSRADGSDIGPELHQGSSEHIRFMRARLVDDNGELAPFLQTGDEIRVQFWFDVLQTVRDTRITLSISTGFGERLLAVSDADDRDGAPRTIEQGSYQAELTLPGIFRGGIYTVGLGANQTGPGNWWCLVSDALRFQIEDHLADSHYNVGLLKVPAAWSFTSG